MSNYQPQGSFQNLMCQGTLVAPTGDDLLLLNQQTQYANLCQSFVGKVSAVRDGKDATNAAQKFYLNLISTTPLTLAIAQSYFANATAIYWNTGGLVDYKGAYNKITTTSY